MKQYAYSRDQERYHDKAKSVNDAIAEACMEPGETIYIGEVIEFHPHIDADHVLEQLECEAEDVCGESADEWLSFVPKEEKEKLEVYLNEAFQKWMTETNNHPHFYSIDSDTVTTYTLPEETK